MTMEAAAWAVADELKKLTEATREQTGLLRERLPEPPSDDHKKAKPDAETQGQERPIR